MIEGLNFEDLSEQKITSKENVIKRDMSIYGHVKAKAHILVGNAEISVEELMSLKKGSVVKMLENIEEPMLLVLDGKTIAKGSLVVVDDVFGFEITEISE